MGTVVAAAPAAIAPSCHATTQRQCRQVPVQVPRSIAVPRCAAVPVCRAVPKQKCSTVARQVPETNCVNKPVTECTTINRQVPETQCVDKPVQECTTVGRQVPVEVPVQKCADVPREVCHPVHEKVARQVCENVAVKHHSAHVASRHGGVYANSPAVSKAVHGVSAPTAYAYGVGKSFSRRDY